MEPVIQFASAFMAYVDRDEATQKKYGPEYYDDPRVKKLVQVIENDLGVRQIQILGGGSFGLAASTEEEGGDVVKLTIDPSEVESGAVLTSTKPEAYPHNVVRMQGAWYVRKLSVFGESWFDPDSEIWHHAKRRIGILRMERVHALDFFENARTIQGLAEYVRYVKHEYKLWAFQTHKLSRAKVRERFLRGGTQLESLLTDVWKLHEDPIARDVARAIGQLRAVGVYGIDFHGGNVGWVPVHEAQARSNPVEETMQYAGAFFDLVTADDVFHPGTGFFVRMGMGDEYGPFSERDQAIQFAHDKIDEKQRRESSARPLPEQPAPPERVYKVFDIGMSSLAPGAPKPSEFRERTVRKTKDREAFSEPIVAGPVRVAELG